MRKTQVPRISAKKLKANGGKTPWSSITSPRTPIAKGGKPKPVNRKRKDREFKRCYHSAERVAFVASLPCVVTGETPCENAHIAGDGMGRKGHYGTIIPLAPCMHRLQHQIGAGSFAIRFSLDLRALAAATEKLWQDHQARNAA